MIFAEEQNFAGALVTEVTVDAARLVLVGAQGEALLDVPVAGVRNVDRGRQARTERLKAEHVNHGRPWDESERTRLREMCASKTPMREMINQIGRSSGSIRGEMRRLGLVVDGAEPVG
ncbi:hypothetical protein [Spirillospora sp. NBC_01491]|uniref:hypothetical protein n=1 Tax=Spirillospora sp. NBC_01491 TaxID=2976007 RepID=UPI002E2F64DA|nr:hypothetical protein [Spirillospora sp. NBC_01491]